MKLLCVWLALRKFVIILTLFIVLMQAYPPGWSDDVLIAIDTTRTHSSSDITVDSYFNVWIAWDDANWTDGDVYYVKLDSLGNEIVSKSNVSNNFERSLYVRLNIDNSNNIQFIWRGDSPEGIGLWHARIAQDTSTLVSSHLAVSGSGGMMSSLLPEMLVDRHNQVHVAWDEITESNKLLYTKLDSMGNPIITKIQITPAGIDYSAYWVGIGLDSLANAHLGCRLDSNSASDLLAYTKIDATGQLLIANRILTEGTKPAFVCDEHQNMHIVYVNPSSGVDITLEYIKIDQNGNILIGPDTIGLINYAHSYPDLSIDSTQMLHTVFQADIGNQPAVWYMKLDTAGNIITSPMEIVGMPYTNGAIEPRITVDLHNRLHVTWIDSRFITNSVFYKRGENEPTVEEHIYVNAASVQTIICPNPFYNSVRIYIDRAGITANSIVRICNCNGQVIKEIIPNELSNYVMWYGDDGYGVPVSAGVYFVSITYYNKSSVLIPIIRLH